MDARALFLTSLPERAQSRTDRAVFIASFAKLFEGAASLNMRQICSYFEAAHLARPNTTELTARLVKDRRVSVRSGQVKALQKGDTAFRETFPELFQGEAAVLEVRIDVRLLASVPFIDAAYLDELRDMAGLYEALHVLENSMRRLIEAVLWRKLGDGWWELAASAPMKRKHEERLQKEAARKWLPARSALGPLYSVDWADLITLVRKYEEAFEPFIGEIGFMHRYADLGLLRHVIAHHGFIEDAHAEGQRVAVALRDWNSQVMPAVRKFLP